MTLEEIENKQKENFKKILIFSEKKVVLKNKQEREIWENEKESLWAEKRFLKNQYKMVKENEDLYNECLARKKCKKNQHTTNFV